MQRHFMTLALLLMSALICGCQPVARSQFTSGNSAEWVPATLQRCSEGDAKRLARDSRRVLDDVLNPILLQRKNDYAELIRSGKVSARSRPGFTLQNTWLFQESSPSPVRVLLACYADNRMPHAVQSDVIVVYVTQGNETLLCEALINRLAPAGTDCIRVWRSPHDRSVTYVFLGTYGECFQGYAPVSLDVWDVSKRLASRKILEITGSETQIAEEVTPAESCEPFELKIRSYCGQLHTWCRLAKPYNTLIERGDDRVDSVQVHYKAIGVTYHKLTAREFLLTMEKPESSVEHQATGGRR